MLTIRPEQIAVFQRVESDRFEEWMLLHLHRFFPGRCRAAGEYRLREIVRIGIDKAAKYGISIRRDVCKYIDLMVVLGPDFDTDRRLSWARNILLQQATSAQRLRDLLAAAQVYLRRL